jgi:replication-associated recombination protein RarA
MQQQLSELLRPTELADLIQPLELIQGLERMVEKRSLLNMLFYGKPGLGKTSAAQILLKALDAFPLRINGSMRTGIDVVREMEKFCEGLSIFGDMKVCFIDECEYLSPNAQAGLRGLIEQSHGVPFMMTANDVSKLHPALKSRCMPISFDINPLQAGATIGRLLPRYADKLARLGYANIDAKWLSDEMHLVFPDLRKLANAIEFRYGAPNEERAAQFQMEQNREAGMVGDGHKAA